MIKIFYCLFKQAGLLLLTQGFTQFKWEEKVQQLNLPYFNLGQFLLKNKRTIVTWIDELELNQIIILAFIILAFGLGISTLTFVCEMLKKEK